MNRSRKSAAALAVALVCWAPVAQAGEFGDLAPIDRQLLGQVDFRDQVFSDCFARSTCSAGGLTVTAERQAGIGGAWGPAEIYWDPIDGFGVLGGGQDDEIEFDERLVVRFERQVLVAGFWFTDMFGGEHARYAGKADPTAPAPAGDSETALVTLVAQGAPTVRIEVNGDLDLPAVSFNTAVAPETFRQSQDSGQRVLIDDGAALVMADTGAGEVAVGVMELDASGVVVGRALGDGITNDLGVVQSEVPESNAARLAGLLEHPELLGDMRQAAQVERLVSDGANGEVSGVLEVPAPAQEVLLAAKQTPSNEFSVAGIMLSEARAAE